MTQDELEAQGWTFDLEAAPQRAVGPDGFVVEVASDDPAAIFAVVSEVDNPPAAPPPAPPDPPVPASVAAATAVAAAMATVAITSPDLTDAQKTSIQTQVQAEVDAVIQQHLDGTA
jgi:hypothetical protein